MQGKLTPLSPLRVIKALEETGFSVIRQRGSHVVMSHPDGRTTVVPYHKGEDLGIGITRKIIREAGLTREEFLEILEKT